MVTHKYIVQLLTSGLTLALFGCDSTTTDQGIADYQNYTVSTESLSQYSAVADDGVTCAPVQVDISGSRLLGKTGTSNSTPQVYVGPISEGNYQIRLHYEDELHPDQPDQLNEQWYVELIDELGSTVFATTESIDLPSDEIVSYTDIGSYYIKADIYSIRGVHAFESEEYNSIHPTLVEFFPDALACDPRDTVPPLITLLGANPLTLVINDTYIDPGATAFDNIDGNITNAIVVAGDEVNTAVAGSYVVTYNVSDSTGNKAVQVTRVVEVYLDAQ